MINKKIIAKEWLLILFSILIGHLFLAIIVVAISPLYSFDYFYQELKEYPWAFFIAALYFYLFVQIIRSVIWSIKIIIKK
jgi:multisubunit Na+/H+ antiporter MnhE subunit